MVPGEVAPNPSMRGKTKIIRSKTVNAVNNTQVDFFILYRMSKIKLRLFLKGGLEKAIEISELKPTSYIFEEASKLAGRKIEYLETENGKEIPSKGVMIKNVPLRNGVSVHEDADEVPQIDPRAKYKDPYLSSEVWIGRVKREDVFHVKVWFLGRRQYITFMVYKDATVDEFKSILGQLKRANRMWDNYVYEYTFEYEREEWGSRMITGHWLGWEGNIERNARRYVGSKTLKESNVVDEQDFYERGLPKTREQEDREYEEATRRRRENIKREKEERAKRGEDTEGDKFWNEFWRKRGYGTGIPSSSSVPKPKSCEATLQEFNIKSRKDFLVWAVTNHPDKFPDASEEEAKVITERFQIVSNCVDTVYARKGGNKNRKTRKLKQKRKQK